MFILNLLGIYLLSIACSFLFLVVFMLIFEHEFLLRGRNHGLSIYKFIFISILFLPSCMYLDSLAMFNRFHLFKLLFFLYSITFLDSSESNGNGRVCDWVMNNCTGWLFAMIKKRLSLQAVKMQELDGRNQYLFAIHPHGILPIGGFSAFVASPSTSASQVSISLNDCLSVIS